MDDRLLAFVGLSVAVVVIPGPDMALVARNVLRHGQAAGFATSFGVCTGILASAIAAALGVAALLATSAAKRPYRMNTTSVTSMNTPLSTSICPVGLRCEHLFGKLGGACCRGCSPRSRRLIRTTVRYMLGSHAGALVGNHESDTGEWGSLNRSPLQPVSTQPDDFVDEYSTWMLISRWSG